MDKNTCVELSFDPVDWEQLELLARLTPAERVLAMMRAQAFVMAGIRGAFARRFPELSQSELNMKVLAFGLHYITSHRFRGISCTALDRVTGSGRS